MDRPANELRLRLSTLPPLLLLILGLPLASWLAFSRWRWKFLVEAVVALPIILPPTVLGFYVLIAIGPHSPIGQAYVAITGRGLPFTFQGLLVASVLYSLPFAVQPFTAAISNVDKRLIEASWCLGRGWLTTFFLITVPLAWPGILTGIVLSFAHTLGEFGVVLMIGGNLPGITRTISISIYDSVQGMQFGEANETALVLLAFSFAVLASVYALIRKPWSVAPLV